MSFRSLSLVSLRPWQSERQQCMLRPPHRHMLTPTGYPTTLFRTRYPSNVEHDTLTSLFVTGLYSMSSGSGVRLIRGSSGRGAGSGKRGLFTTSHLSSSVIPDGPSSPLFTAAAAILL